MAEVGSYLIHGGGRSYSIHGRGRELLNSWWVWSYPIPGGCMELLNSIPVGGRELLNSWWGRDLLNSW